MKKICCVICSKYRKFYRPKILYILEKTLVLSVTNSKCENEDEELFKEEESTDILKVLGLFENT